MKNHEKTRKKANFKNHEKTMKKTMNSQKTNKKLPKKTPILPEAYKLLAITAAAVWDG